MNLQVSHVNELPNFSALLYESLQVEMSTQTVGQHLKIQSTRLLSMTPTRNLRTLKMF